MHGAGWLRLPSWVPGAGGGIALAVGVIEVSEKENGLRCYKELNSSCFGQCLFKLQVQQTGPVHNLSSLAAPHYGAMRRKTCECPHGYGVYHAINSSATWYFTALRGEPAPRVMNVTIERDNKVVLRHAQIGERTCPYIFDVTDGLVMGLQAKGGSTRKKGSGFPLWATILLAMGGVFLLAGIVFMLIGKNRKSSGAAAAGGASRKKKGGRGGGENEPTLRDPLLPTTRDSQVKITSEQSHGK